MRIRATCALGALCAGVYFAHPSFAHYALFPSHASPITFGTSVFLHRDVGHLSSNLVALAIFGSIYEKKKGSLSLLGVFAAGGLLASVAEYLSDPTYTGAVIGASGAVATVIGACADSVRNLLCLLPLFLTFAYYSLGFGDPSNANYCHLAGMVLGLVFAAFSREKNDGQGAVRAHASELG